MKKIFLPLSILAVVFLAQPCQAQTFPGEIEIFADRLEKEGNVVSATGRVVALYQDYVLSADSLRYDLDQKKGQAEGKINLKQGDSFLSASKITFDLVGKTAEATLFKGTLAKEGRFEGEKITLAPSRVEAEKAEFIPCLTAEPYSIASEKIVYYPDQEESNLVLNQASLIVGKRKTITLPTLAVTVGKAREKQILTRLQPRAGYNAYEGLFAQGQLPYRLGENSFGNIPFHYSLYRGLFAEIDHTLSLGRSDEIFGSASYQNPWEEGQGGIRSNLIARHRFDNSASLEMAAGYRSEINNQAISRLEISSFSPNWRFYDFNLNARGSFGYLYEERTNVNTQRTVLHADWSRAFPFGLGDFSLYGWQNEALYSEANQFSSLLGLRINQEIGAFSGFVGGEGLRLQGESPLLIDSQRQDNRLYGGLGMWIDPNWRIAVDSSFLKYLPTGAFAPTDKWIQNDLGIGLDFRTQCLGWQLRFQPLIFGLKLDYQLTKF